MGVLAGSLAATWAGSGTRRTPRHEGQRTVWPTCVGSAERGALQLGQLKVMRGGVIAAGVVWARGEETG